jgi:protein O-GlcNAc transferase
LPTRLESVRATIAGADLDALFFADIGMHPLTHFLAYARLAPVQLTTWGHPVTTGIGTMDYFVSHEALEGPGAEAHYSEKLLRLPAFFMPRYQKPELAQARSRCEQGLPEDRHLYVCPQTLFKLHPDFDVALREILEQDPAGELILLEGHPRWTELLRRRFRATLADAERRVRFMPQRRHHEFLHLLAAADVILDPFYFGGNNSSCEALGLGQPVVTLPAERVAGRFTQALYREMGLVGCIAASPDDYVRLAVELGTQPQRRKEMSGEIRARNECIFQRTEGGRALGDALLRVVA